MATIQTIQQDCWDNALHCIGTSHVFSKRAKSFKTRIRFMTVLGLVVPLLLGGTAAAYGQNSSILGIAITITAPVTIFQIALFGISLIYKWDDQFAYSLESQTDNRIISESFQNLAKNPSATLQQMQSDFDVIKAKEQARTTQDDKYSFSKKENRLGMRYALWIMKRQCATCNQVPQSMTPTKCDTCGNF